MKINKFNNINLKINNEIHLYMMLTTNLLILFCVWIKVRRIKRFQFDAVWMMLEHCVIRKVIMQSFHSCDNLSSNSHNWSTKKINDMSISVDWSRWVEYSSLSRVLNLKSVELNWIFFEKVLSWVEKLNSRTRIELKSLTQQLNSTIQLNNSTQQFNSTIQLNNSTQQFNSTRQDIK